MPPNSIHHLEALIKIPDSYPTARLLAIVGYATSRDRHHDLNHDRHTDDLKPRIITLTLTHNRRIEDLPLPLTDDRMIRVQRSSHFVLGFRTLLAF